MKYQSEPCHPRGPAGGQRVLSWRWGQIKKAWGGSIQSYVNAPFVDTGAVPTASTQPHAGLISHFYTHTSNQVPSTYTYNKKNTLHSVFVPSSKMLISGNHATVCCMLITSDCTTHYASEVNYEQNEGKMGPQSLSSSHQFSTCGTSCCFWLTTYCLCMFILFSFCSPAFPVYQSFRWLMSLRETERAKLCACVFAKVPLGSARKQADVWTVRFTQVYGQEGRCF